MKIDRILGIIIYLFNHDKVSAKTLAEKYDVSVRTIQRDMVNIASCGIPIRIMEKMVVILFYQHIN